MEVFKVFQKKININYPLERGKKCLPIPRRGWFIEHQLIEGIRKEEKIELFSNLIESNVRDN
jgi:hypothetical protein